MKYPSLRRTFKRPQIIGSIILSSRPWPQIVAVGTQPIEIELS